MTPAILVSALLLVVATFYAVLVSLTHPEWERRCALGLLCVGLFLLGLMCGTFA